MLVFVGANRSSKTNVAIACLNFLISKFHSDIYNVVVTDNDIQLINFLKINKITFFKKSKIKNIFKSTFKNQYDWLLNIWGHCVFPNMFLSKFQNNLNIHPSLLPYGKGKDSSLWTIVNNYPAGTTLHKMTNKLDGGPVYCQKQFKYFFPTTGNDIYQKSIEDSVILFIKNWPSISNLKTLHKKQRKNNIKSYLRSEMIQENLVNLDDYKNYKIKKFIIKSLGHDFYPNFNIKIKFNNKIYNFKSLIS